MSAEPGQYVTLGLGAEVFAVPVAMVREILDYRDAFAIPDGPAWLCGLIDVRGRGTPVIDLRTKLGLKRIDPTAATRILVLDVPFEGRTLSLGLVADRVLEVASFLAHEIEGPPDVGVSWRSEYIAGVVHRNNGFVVLFDVAHLITAADAAALANSTEKAA